MKTPQARKASSVSSLGLDGRVEHIALAVAACDAAGRRKLHVANGEYAWPRNFVALLDEMRLHGVPDAQILAVGDALRDAAYKTVYVGTGEPTESAGEVFALEAVAEGEANRDVARLIDAPHDEHAQRQALRSLSWHETMIGHAKRVLQRNLTRRSVAGAR